MDALPCLNSAYSSPLHSLNKLRISESERPAHHGHSSGQPNHYISLVLATDGGPIRQSRSGQTFEWVPQVGDISIAPAHSGGQCHSRAWTRRITISLQPKLLEEVARDAFDSQALSLSVRFATQDDTLRRLILLLHCEAQRMAASQSGKIDSLMTDSLTTALAVQLLRQHAEQHAVMEETTCTLCGGLSLRAQRQILEYITDHLGGDISLDAMANVVGLSRYHFIRAFKNTLGLTPHQYVLTQRVEAAKKLIHAGRFSLREIAQLSGFADQSHFTRQFRRLTGTTPKAFGSGVTE